MALIIERYIICDYKISSGCHQNFGLLQPDQWDSNKSIFNAAVSKGWKLTLKDKKHICPACQELRRRRKGVIV